MAYITVAQLNGQSALYDLSCMLSVYMAFNSGK